MCSSDLRNIRWFGRDLGWNPTIPLAKWSDDLKSRAVAVDCTFAFARPTANAAAVLNYDSVSFLRCKAAYAGLDLFNFHHTAWYATGFNRPRYLEEDCVALQSAWRGSVGPNQCSTIHDGIAGVRINPTYVTAGGPAVQDQGLSTDVRCYSWNLGGSYTLTASSDSTWHYPVLCSNNCSMWLDNPTLVGGAGAVRSQATDGMLYVRGNVDLSTALAEAGLLTPY